MRPFKLGQTRTLSFIAITVLLIALGGCNEPNANTCGDGACDAYLGETGATCSADCPTKCGDGICTAAENHAHCPQDCTTTCGDGACNSGEKNASCPRDCPAVCGDKICNGAETPEGCPGDCPRSCNGTCAAMCGGCNNCCFDGDGTYCLREHEQCN